MRGEKRWLRARPLTLHKQHLYRKACRRCSIFSPRLFNIKQLILSFNKTSTYNYIIYTYINNNRDNEIYTCIVILFIHFSPRFGPVRSTYRCLMAFHSFLLYNLFFFSHLAFVFFCLRFFFLISLLVFSSPVFFCAITCPPLVSLFTFCRSLGFCFTK